MLRIASHNVNGIRATHQRGWVPWVNNRGIDVIGLQEVRATPKQYPEGVFDGWDVHLDTGEMKGRNGVALLSKAPVESARTGIGLDEFAADGRYVEIDLADYPLTIASLYLPKGDVPDGEDEAKQAKYDRKFRFLTRLAELLKEKADTASNGGREFLIVGDFNIARSELDIKNWKGNLKSEGFLPEERQWFADMLSDTGLVDIVRTMHPDQPGPYSWWSWRGQAFANDAGWRIDYHLATPGLAKTAVASGVDREASRDERLSDHSPVVVDYNFN